MGITSRGLTWSLEVKCMTIARRAGCGEEPGPTCLRPSTATVMALRTEIEQAHKVTGLHFRD